MSLIYPVIHHLNREHTFKQAEIAVRSGAHGVFLISHHGIDEPLGPLAKEIKDKYPTFQVGLNFLGLGVIEAVNTVKEYNLDMAWGDSCGVSSTQFNHIASELKHLIEGTNIKLFASVAFKYQPYEPNPSKAATNALSANFIPTTSGEATGAAPSVEKIKEMSNATNGVLAIASGMTPENVSQYKEYLSHILVSTGVSLDFHTFAEEKLELFVQEAK